MKKGFTLVELLAVIVILAVILAIAIPGISGIIKNSTMSSFESDAKMLLKAVDYKLLEDSSYDITSINTTNIENILRISPNNYQAITISMVSGKPYIIVEGKNKWSGLVAHGSYTDMIVTEGSYESVTDQLGFNQAKGVNEPKLTTGMTPIKWNGSAWVDTTVSDTDWYNYNTTDKKWANARTTDGSMWVWIPRYIYKISSGWHSNTTGSINIQFSKGTDDNWNSSAIGNIDTGTTSESSNNKWTNHPAFTFDSTELAGIWVAKFEATAVEGVANGYTLESNCPIDGDDTIKTIKIIPNVQSWRCMINDNSFLSSRNMETNTIYGWGTSGEGIDTHLMKNIEWGAIAYLSKSVYGQDTNEIWINNSQQYITGCAGYSASSTAYDGCQNAYDTENGMKASTTGNIYGIYDMVGGAFEKVAAYVENSQTSLTSPLLAGAADKYKDIYTAGSTDDRANNYALAINKKGDAVYETSSLSEGSTSWFGDYSYMPATDRPWFNRGGDAVGGSTSGIFNFSYVWLTVASSNGFRPVLLVQTGI
jgi:prepilin-type N-terminal cleavage/methylation domain-containing protein